MLLKNCRYLLTQNTDRDILEHVDVRIDNGRIVEIGKGLRTDDRTVDCAESVVMPGLVNAHTHVAMNLFRGIADNLVLQDWLEDVIFPAEDRMTEDDVYHGALHGMAEMLQTGTTCFNDMYAPEGPVADAVDETGMRAVLAQGVIDIDSGPAAKLADSKAFVEQYQDHDRITPAVAPHAVYTCSDELLQGAKEQADRFDAPLHIHLSETEQENTDCRDAHGMTPTAYLADLGVLGEETVAAHGTRLTVDDQQLLADHGAGVAHNPCANLKLGSGIAPVPDLRNRGATVGLGTDGVASNNNLNLFEEAKFAALLQKRHDPRQLDEQAVLDMMTISAAELLGLDNAIGSIEPGKQADIVTVPLDTVTLSPRYGKRGLLSNLVFAFNGPVEHVFVGGEQLVDAGTVTTVDTAENLSDVQERTKRFV